MSERCDLAPAARDDDGFMLLMDEDAQHHLFIDSIDFLATFSLESILLRLHRVRPASLAL